MKKESQKSPATAFRGERLLLIDISNSFTKITLARNGVIKRVHRIPTSTLSTPSPAATRLLCVQAERAIISSVVPKVTRLLEKLLPCPIIWVNHTTAGVRIRYPNPATIGADRLANVAAAVSLGKLPAIVVDFGTAVTFDVIDDKGRYLGGIIAPGLSTAAAALHERTALLPLIKIENISSPIGKSTQKAIQIGLLLGAVGIVREVVDRVAREAFAGKHPVVIATGGDAKLVDHLSQSGGGKRVIDLVDPLLTLKGLLEIAGKQR